MIRSWGTHIRGILVIALLALAVSVTGTSTAALAAPATAGACGVGQVGPTVCLPAGAGEDQTGTLLPGTPIDFAVEIANPGPARADAELVIPLPDDLEVVALSPERIDTWTTDVFRPVDSGFGFDLQAGPTRSVDCGDGVLSGTVTCHTGALAQGADILIGMTVRDGIGTARGVTATLAVSLEPLAGVPTFAPSSVQAVLDVARYSSLRTSSSVTTPVVTIGTTLPIHVEISNYGPDVAHNVVLRTFIDGFPGIPDRFDIVNAPPTSPPTSAPRMSADWPLGDLRDGQTRSFTILVDASSEASTFAFVFASADEGSALCRGDGLDTDICESVTTLEINSVLAPVATPTPTPSRTAHPGSTPTHPPASTASRTGPRSSAAVDAASVTAGASGPQLAATGSSAGPILDVGVIVLAVGATTTWVARRRPHNDRR